MSRLFLVIAIMVYANPVLGSEGSSNKPDKPSIHEKSVAHTSGAPRYVPESWYADLKVSFPLPPKQGSDRQKNDVFELFEYQKTRKVTDCEQANLERLASLTSFFGTSDSPISKSDIEQLKTFFKQIRVDVAFLVRKLKQDFARKRPFLDLTGLEPCVPKEGGESYPSGHAVLSKLYALVLGEMYPNHRIFLESRAKQIADHRVLVGLHYRTDVEAGDKVAVLIYEQLKKSPRFQEDLAAYQKRLSSEKHK